MGVESKVGCISGKQVKELFNEYDNQFELMDELKRAAHDFGKDIDALVHSMANLYEQEQIKLAMADVTVEVRMEAFGQEIIKARIGTPGLVNEIVDEIRAKEAKNGI